MSYATLPRSRRSSTWSALNTLGPIVTAAIIIRAGFRCAHCGLRTTRWERQIDHVVPRCMGGSNKPDNLVLACSECNLGRTRGGIPERALRCGRSQEDIDQEIARQTSIPIERGSELYERARRTARRWWPAQFERRRRAWDRATERQLHAFFEGVAA